MAKRKLQMLSNHVFEELAMDVYDEVDRRETDAIWNGMLSKVSRFWNFLKQQCTILNHIFLILFYFHEKFSKQFFVENNVKIPFSYFKGI